MRAGPNFNNVAITGGELTFVGGNINNAPPLKGLDLMLSQCTPGALLNSKERSDPPRCADETRTAILNSLLRWISSNIASNVASIAWLHGPAGGGKTAIAQTLGEQCQKKGLLAATFFFSRTDSEDRSDGDRVISTIAAELIRLIPELKPLVIKAIDDDPFLLSKVMEEQLYELMVKPLRTLAQARGKELGPRLVVIDALDECNDMDAQVDLIKTIANAVPQLAFPFCFLIVSRPESHIVDAFAREPLQSTTTLRLDLSKDTSADADIQLFLELGFEDILSHHRHRRLLPSPWPPVGVIPALVKQSSRQFIYPSTVIKYVRDPKHHPFRRLQDILGLSPSSSKGRPFAGLDSLYTFIFSRVENDNIEVITRFFSLLLVIKSTQNPDRVNLRPAATQLEEFLELDSGDLYFLLDPFLSLLSMPEDPSHDIEIFHISLLDFLLDTNRSFDIRRRGFNISLPLGHTVAAIYWWRRLPDPDRPQGTRITSHFHFIQHCSLVGRLSETLYQCITCAELPRPMEPLQKLWYMWRILCNMLLTRQPTFESSDSALTHFHNDRVETQQYVCREFLLAAGDMDGVVTFCRRELIAHRSWRKSTKHLIVALGAEKRFEGFLDCIILSQCAFRLGPSNLSTADELDSAVFKAVSRVLLQTPRCVEKDQKKRDYQMCRECWGFDENLTLLGFERVKTWNARVQDWERIYEASLM